MRFSHFSIIALSGLSMASPVVQKRADVVSLLTGLYATVQTYTEAINANLTPLSASSPLLEKAAATAEVGVKINLITTAVTATTSEIKVLPPVNSTIEKRFANIDEDMHAQPKEKRQLIAVSAILALIIVETFATVTAAVAILGLAGLLIFLNPLTGAISALILAVQLILDVVLADVIALLDGLLTSLALDVSGF
ncbi:uncharacterized protein M421DRAFT_405023 [Didymella exigua CBS 183.55]|uniref:Uncharacterized protein n=1 Tax=Didymella exigua CBS 183.55 TaxID=1150837 RepID=A0A6A5R920_9PLEO|nr:uncharacterized protein M421DRAFT_405023 [Didymella exigua CBS 183.55]KAF1923730.1 hypothetical protein M421DRAFT_405023 [Didymella exigua CBS 183.55]